MANCCNCSNLVKTQNISVSGSTMTLTIENQTINNGDVMCIYIANLPTAWSGSAPNLVISVDGTEFNGLTKCGNYLYADQFINCNGVLQTKQIIKVRFATDSKSFVYVGSKTLCKSANYIAPVTAPSGTPA